MIWMFLLGWVMGFAGAFLLADRWAKKRGLDRKKNGFKD